MIGLGKIEFRKMSHEEIDFENMHISQYSYHYRLTYPFI